MLPRPGRQGGFTAAVLCSPLNRHPATGQVLSEVEPCLSVDEKRRFAAAFMFPSLWEL